VPSSLKSLGFFSGAFAGGVSVAALVTSSP